MVDKSHDSAEAPTRASAEELILDEPHAPVYVKHVRIFAARHEDLESRLLRIFFEFNAGDVVLGRINGGFATS
jgi:hypothetical protein